MTGSSLGLRVKSTLQLSYRQSVVSTEGLRSINPFEQKLTGLQTNVHLKCQTTNLIGLPHGKVHINQAKTTQMA